MARTVAIVFAEDFSAQLEQLSFHTPVWLVDTPENRAAAEAAWQRAIEWPHISVTLFRSPEDWSTFIEQIVLHEHSVDAFDVFGVTPAAIVRNAFLKAGYERVDETANGFRARR